MKLVFVAFALLLQFESIAKVTYSNISRYTPRVVTVSASLQRITDIDIVKREYKLELWLKFEAKSEDSCALSDLDKQIAIKEAKDIEIDIIPNWQTSIAKCDTTFKPKSRKITKTLRIRCTMIQNWNVSGYPFDRQTLNISIYNPQRALRWFKLEPKDSLLYYYEPLLIKDTLIEIENGWVFSKNSARVDSLKTLLEDPFKDNYYDTKEIKQYSTIHYILLMERVNKWSLFIKLLVGMYVAFFVAFIAMFIKMDHTEVRFSLPVGGLFAAIANKYIMESILPQSPDFSLADWLHSVTIIFILLITAYSAWHLHKIKKEPALSMDSYRRFDIPAAKIFFIAYLLLNLTLINRVLH